MLIWLLACNGKAEDTSIEIDCSGYDLAVPAARGEIGGVWDQAGQRFVFFGGNLGLPIDCVTQNEFIDDTWAYVPACETFVEIEATGPSARGRYAAALDADGGRMLVHGGRYRDDEDSSGGHGHGSSSSYTNYGDLWAFDLASDSWTQLDDGSSGPEARSNHAMWVIGETVYVHGGNTSDSGLSYDALDDLWAYDLGTGVWSELSVSGGPSKRLFHTVAVTDDGSYAFFYGGADNGSFSNNAEFLGDVWALEMGSLDWSKLHDGGQGAPDGRFGVSLMVDEGNNQLIMFGGHDDAALGNSNQVWTFDLQATEWTQVQDGDIADAGSNGFCDFPADFTIPDYDAPERRYTHLGVETGAGELLIFGGKSDCGVLNDVWGYDPATNTWAEHSSATAGEICLRSYAECETMCY